MQQPSASVGFPFANRSRFLHTLPVAALLGLLGALTIGVSDLFGRRVVAASSALTAGASMQLFATVFVVAVALTTTSPFNLIEFGWGGVSGVGLGLGILGYYSGLVRSTATIVAPTVASLSALVPFAYTAVRGADVSPTQIAGVLTVVGGLVLVTGGSVSGDDLLGGASWGAFSGLGYSLGAIGFVEVGDVVGWWPAVGQRGAAMVLLFAFAVATRVRPLPPRGQVGNGAMVGLFTGLTSLLYLAALEADPTIGVVAISAFPAFSVLIGRTFFGDTVRPTQAAGIALVIAGVAAVSVG